MKAHKKKAISGPGSAEAHIHRMGLLFTKRAAADSDLPEIVELLACCDNRRERGVVCLMKYQGLSASAAARSLGVTIREAEGLLAGVERRRQMASSLMSIAAAMRRADRESRRSPGAGQEMSLAELERAEGWGGRRNVRHGQEGPHIASGADLDVTPEQGGTVIASNAD